ncbi:MAG: hypothetical protein H7A44_08485 [Opitutaceae bacterium]|nr:hypothetical protein [Cephaloticoccus sp.]MCP5530467.1 hypothetical protein [Opitutaceae bacterium]
MKRLPLLFLGITTLLRADIIFSDFSTQGITLGSEPAIINFSVQWSADIFPITSEPGRIELLNNSGNLIASATAHLWQSGTVLQASAGSISSNHSVLQRMTQELSVADGDLSAQWQLPALSPGNYTLRLWRYDSQYNYVENSTVHTTTLFSGVNNPPPATFSLNTGAGPGGSISSGGVYPAGTAVTVTAFADGQHDFAGWSGDATGGNPTTVVMTANRSVQAHFAIKTYALTTSAEPGGSVTVGGIYPHGSQVTLNAYPDATHRFVSWSGNAAGTASTTTVYMDAPKSVYASFADKLSQTIDFPDPGHPTESIPLPLVASASSGLPVNFGVLSGPAYIANGALYVAGPDPVVIAATQPGNGFYLPAPTVTQTVQIVTTASLQQQVAPRTLLENRQHTNPANYVLSVQP